MFMLAGYPVWWVLGAGALDLAAASRCRWLGRLRHAAGAPCGCPAASAGGCSSSSGCCCRSCSSRATPRCRSSGGSATTSRPPSPSSTSTTRRATGSRPAGSSSLLAGFWLVTVAGGWLGVLLPNGELTTPGRAAPAERLRRARVRPDPRAPDLRPGAGLPRLPARPPDRAVPVHERLGRRVRPDHPVLHPRLAAVPQASRRSRRRCCSSRSPWSRRFLSLNRGLWLSLLVALALRRDPARATSAGWPAGRCSPSCSSASR